MRNKAFERLQVMQPFKPATKFEYLLFIPSFSIQR